MRKEFGMKKNLLKLLLVALLVVILTTAIVACNPNETPQNASDLSSYAGKYYEVRGNGLLADSWIELKADGTWTDDDGASGRYSVNGIKITFSASGVDFEGTLQSGTLSVDVMGVVTAYRQGTPDGGSGDSETKYNVSFILDPDDEYDEEEIAPQSYEAGEIMSSLPIPERDGYNFVEWRDSDGKRYDRSSSMPAANLILSARWEKKVSVYEDDYVVFKPAAEGKKHSNNYYYDYQKYGIDKYIYVELTSEDLGGMANVGEENNFKLSQLEFAIKSNYQWTWYKDDFSTPNGTQRFTLGYGSNIQFVTAQDGAGNVQAIYLVDIYVLHDYKIELYKNEFEYATEAEPYDSLYVVEGNRIPKDIKMYDGYGYEPEGYVHHVLDDDVDKTVSFGLDTVIMQDYRLYQTYKVAEISVDMGDGVLADGEKVQVKPYTRYQQLPTPTLEGYDFIGWKKSDGKYFADITGFSATNYLSAEITKLTAEWREKQLFEMWDGNQVTFCNTVPYGTYTDKSHEEILAVVYSPVGYDCALPTVTDANSYFEYWGEYKYDETKNAYYDNFAQFGGELTSPRALHAHTSGDFKEEISTHGIPLNSMRTFSDNNIDKYRVNLPSGLEESKDFVLRVEGNLVITREKFGSGTDTQLAQSYSVSGSMDIEIDARGYQGLNFTIGNVRGSFKLGLYGPTASSTGTPAVGESIAIGDTLVAEEGEDWCGWLLNGEKVSDGTSRELTFIADMIGKTYEKHYGHTFGEWKIDGEYKCEDTVTRHKDCSVCGYSEVEENYYVDHVMSDWIEDSPASCTAKAHHHKECENCDHREDEDYGQILPHEMSDWIEDSPASCTAKAHHHKECENCDHREDEDYGNLLPHEMSDWKTDVEYTCGDTVTRHRECSNCDYTDVEDHYVVPHVWKEQLTAEKQKECSICGYKEAVYDERDGKIYFGEYPQTRETDNGITASLAQMSGDRPVKGNRGKWTDYGYYIRGEVDEYMWYIDLDYNGARYRGVYFTSYRPYDTTGSSSSSSTGITYQDDNGYVTNTLYWFKWEPIEWRVLERTDGELFLMSNVILDSQQYYRTDSGTRTIDGKTVYPNNYKESDIRAWLNGTFYDQAFDSLEQGIIKTTLVDNSYGDKYACENTNDKVFLLRYKEATNTSYGFSSNSTRQLKPTDYAKSQGVWVSTTGNGYWWLRSPYSSRADDALRVDNNGYADYGSYVDYTRCGVVPALRITM